MRTVEQRFTTEHPERLQEDRVSDDEILTNVRGCDLAGYHIAPLGNVLRNLRGTHAQDRRSPLAHHHSGQ